MRRWCASLALLAALALPGAAAADVLDDAEEAIESFRPVDARKQLTALTAEQAASPRGRYLSGKLLFFEGRYGESRAELRAAIEGARAELDWKLLRDRVAATERAFAGLERVDGRDGKFVFRHGGGADALLVHYAEQTLGAQLDALATLFDDHPAAPIEIDFLPDVEALAAGSGLSVEQIERTGTVGVTKYGRIMVLTPRALATGYPWLDTLAHELTHVWITRASRNRSPIWIQEGVAKLLERRWRGDPVGDLSPQEAYLLDRAARERRLIPLRRFHPSVAHLPNQEDAALAYAQVLSFLRYLDDRFEDGWIRQLLADIGAGKSVEEAFAAQSKFTVRRLYLWWTQTASGRRQTPVPAVGLLKRRYRRGATVGESSAEAELGVEVQRQIRVGDLLRLRGHVKAAAVEFRRALNQADSPSLAITDRLAGCLLELGDHATVAELLPPIGELYPSHATSFVQLGQALAALEQPAAAAAALERARAVNPFHPAVHCLLAEQYRSLGRTAEAGVEREHCRLTAAEAGAEPRQTSSGR